MAQEVKWLTSKCKALSLNFSAEKTNKKATSILLFMLPSFFHVSFYYYYCTGGTLWHLQKFLHNTT
jgi:hypothetical protein